MDKLIELLSRYGKDDDWCLVRVEGNVRKIDEMLIISKQYGFIKWLVDNDKIDYKKIHGEEWYIPLVDMVKFDGSKRLEVLLMLLAIQDEPIEFLIEILK